MQRLTLMLLLEMISAFLSGMLLALMIDGSLDGKLIAAIPGGLVVAGGLAGLAFGRAEEELTVMRRIVRGFIGAWAFGLFAIGVMGLAHALGVGPEIRNLQAFFETYGIAMYIGVGVGAVIGGATRL